MPSLSRASGTAHCVIKVIAAREVNPYSVCEQEIADRRAGLKLQNRSVIRAGATETNGSCIDPPLVVRAPASGLFRSRRLA
jgi:hypothetical protein